MRALWTAVPGVLIVAFALAEVFQDLFHPTLTGSLSDYVARTMFRLFRLRVSMLSLAGPLTIVVVIFSWAFLLSSGFALIYCASFPAGFRAFNGQQPAAGHTFWRMLFFSLQAMTTLGLGDLVPEADWLRILVTVEALLGFALVTASVSWIVLIYPALGRMRTLARRASILANTERETGIPIISGDAHVLLSDLALEVIRTRVDFIHFPMLYYFHADRRRSSLAQALPYLLRLAESSSSANGPERVRFASAMLRATLDDLASVLADRFLRARPTDTISVFRAYAKHHLIRISEP
ncbi:MAG: potassium channel family protein [Bryobacteraceae bacterium]